MLFRSDRIQILGTQRPPSSLRSSLASECTRGYIKIPWISSTASNKEKTLDDVIRRGSLQYLLPDLTRRPRVPCARIHELRARTAIAVSAYRRVEDQLSQPWRHSSGAVLSLGLNYARINPQTIVAWQREGRSRPGLRSMRRF